MARVICHNRPIAVRPRFQSGPGRNGSTGPGVGAVKNDFRSLDALLRASGDLTEVIPAARQAARSSLAVIPGR